MEDDKSCDGTIITQMDDDGIVAYFTLGVCGSTGEKEKQEEEDEYEEEDEDEEEEDCEEEEEEERKKKK